MAIWYCSSWKNLCYRAIYGASTPIDSIVRLMTVSRITGKIIICPIADYEITSVTVTLSFCL